MRLIDAENLILDYSGPAYVPYNDFYGRANLFAEQIRSAPSVDPVHAAGACYCWECKNEISTPQMRKSTGQYWCKYKLQPCNADDFCSQGKPKEEYDGEF